MRPFGRNSKVTLVETVNSNGGLAEVQECIYPGIKTRAAEPATIAMSTRQQYSFGLYYERSYPEPMTVLLLGLKLLQKGTN